MIKYNITSWNSEEDIAITQEVFSELEQRGFPGLPMLSPGEKSFLYSYDDGEIDFIAVFFEAIDEHTGFFYKRIPDSNGSYHIKSAVFQYDRDS